MGNIIKVGVVSSTEDNYGASRITFHFEDQEEKAYHVAFPGLPKTIQTLPKAGEKTLILCEDTHGNENFYYLGPLIPQPQVMQYATSGEVTSRLCVTKENYDATDTKKHFLENPEHFTEYEGSFPNKKDVAIVGRKSEDIILKEGEIDIRCGARCEPINVDNADFKGFINFNENDLAYIQLKHGNNLAQGDKTRANSIINMVADKINLISNQDNNVGKLANRGKLAGEAEQDFDKLMNNLHQLPYGDNLVELLKYMRLAIDKHVHPYPGMEACKDSSVNAIDNYNIDSILSQHIRIS